MTQNKRLALMSGVLGALLVLALYVVFHLAPPVQAQGPIGNVNFAQPFTMHLESVETFLSVRNIGQSAGSVLFKGVSGNACPLLLEGSSDNLNWSVLAGSPPGIAGSSFIYANGFFSYLRIAFNPYANSFCNGLTVTGSYYGYSSPLPINPVDQWFTVPGVASPVSIGVGGSMVVGLDSIECTNTSASVGYLQLFASTSTPTLGSGELFDIGIPAGQTYNSGKLPAFISELQLWAGASTAAGGSTAGGPFVCNFQMNVTGPFYPLPPAAP